MSAGWKREKKAKHRGHGNRRSAALCGIREGSCRCGLGSRHGSGIHRCGQAGCNGSWRYENGEFVNVTWPIAPSVLYEMAGIYARGGAF